MSLRDVNWEFNAAGTWPLYIKISIILVVCSAVIGGWYYFDTMEQWDELKVIEKKELALRKDFEDKQKKAVNLQAYRDQLKQIEASLGEMLRQLPTKQEVASLLIDISQTGLASGLEFELFQPSGLVHKDFYSELPIKMRVKGRYEEFGLFVSGLASLPRIVTIHNVQIQPTSGDQMLMKALVKTYSENLEPAKKPKRGKGKKRRGRR